MSFGYEKDPVELYLFEANSRIEKNDFPRGAAALSTVQFIMKHRRSRESAERDFNLYEAKYYELVSKLVKCASEKCLLWYNEEVVKKKFLPVLTGTVH